MIGILHGIVELGRADISCELQITANGHSKSILSHVYIFKAKMQFEMVFDPTRPDNDGKLFPKQDWDHTSYSTTNESLPSYLLKLEVLVS
jgi:hypothetical protein